jgi:coenzyme F420-reducing hydrogenase alpha subunit
MANKTIRVSYLSRVEGEGALNVEVRDGLLTQVKLNIFEAPRFFEALLRGRRFDEAPDITSRICGICPVAYQISAVQAIEDAFGIEVDEQVRAVRRLIYCGEWIESHALHIHMLHAPDFLGYPDGIQMARDYPSIIQRGLQLKKAGNSVMASLGGREIHPINIRAGGFYRLPVRRELEALAERLKSARDAAIETVKWTGSLPIPDYERDYEFVALRDDRQYPIDRGRLVSSKGLDIATAEYDAHFIEEQVAHSNALQSRLKERGHYLCGPLARFNLNFDLLSDLSREAAVSAGLSAECRNPYKSIIIRAVEILEACQIGLDIIERYEEPDRPAEELEPYAAIGFGATEAPRGMLYHRYRFDGRGMILDARIVPPTAQNQPTIEDDLREMIPAHLHLPDEELSFRCEQAIRNYDPCISCATHFLKLKIDRR